MLTLTADTTVSEVTPAQFNVAHINSIATLYKPLRQRSKGPSFALTYAGTWTTLVTKQGFDPITAKKIEKNFHDLYSASITWVDEKLISATKTGYVEGAFGLRLRTPILGQTILHLHQTPNSASAEGRTAGNMLGQSFGLLNNRVLIKVMEEVYASKYKYDIKPCASIHDATYFYIKNDITIVKWLNDVLIKHMDWQDLPSIQHDIVGLGGELDIFYRNWNNDITLPNNATEQEILSIATKGALEYDKL